ncbi:MAG: TRAP transporter substrate-binding protein DctP [Pseudomonadota bacterium]
MKTVRLFVVLSLVFALVTIVAVPPSSAKPIVLKWTTFEPDVPGSTQLALKRMGDLIEQKTEGRVKIKVYWGSVLGKAPDFLKMVRAGVADGAFLVPTYNQWEVPLFAAGGLPFLYTGHREGSEALWNLYKEWPAMQEELKKAKIKPIYFFQPHEHWTGVKDPIKTMDDLKGKKVWAAGFWQELVDALGIVNVPMIAPQAYEALQKGLITGVVGMPYHTFRIFKYTEVVKYLVKWPLGGQPVCANVIGQSAWDKISPKDQKIMEEVGAGMPAWYVDLVDKEAVKLKGFFEKQGVKEIRLPDAEYERLTKIGRDAVWSSWLKTAKQQGVPGEEWFKRYQAKLKEVQK